MTVMTTGTMVGLVTRGLVSAGPLGEENELVDATELVLTAAGNVLVWSIQRGTESEGEALTVPTEQPHLF